MNFLTIKRGLTQVSILILIKISIHLLFFFFPSLHKNGIFALKFKY